MFRLKKTASSRLTFRNSITSALYVSTLFFYINGVGAKWFCVFLGPVRQPHTMDVPFQRRASSHKNGIFVLSLIRCGAIADQPHLVGLYFQASSPFCQRPGRISFPGRFR